MLTPQARSAQHGNGASAHAEAHVSIAHTAAGTASELPGLLERSAPGDARAAERDLAAAVPARRDSDWGARARTHEDDLGWAAKRAAVTIAAAMLDACDGATGAHCDDVVHLCDAIADELGVYGNDRAELLATAQLHDIGKVAVSPDVLNSPAPLDEHGWTLIRRHTETGERIIRSVRDLRDVARFVRHSHERWDGAGYPDGLSGEQIPLASRIVFCADTFHAIRSDRPYRQGRTAQSALAEVQRAAGSQLDPEVTDALVRVARQLRIALGPGADGLTKTLRSRRLVELLV